MATTLSSPLPDPGGCLICQRLALAVVLVDLANTSKEIIPCFSITARFAGYHRSLRPDTARLPVQSVPVAIRQRHPAMLTTTPRSPPGLERTWEIFNTDHQRRSRGDAELAARFGRILRAGDR